jgi:methyl-accepting chemotaxis protein
MLRFTARVTLPVKTTALAGSIMVLAIVAVAGAILFSVSEDARRAAQVRQEQSLLIAATLLAKAPPEVSVRLDTAGRVTRIEAPAIAPFDDHGLIDEIGALTGETATVFVWDETQQDYVRRTTNIRKPDGSRAIGTVLGSASVAFAPVKGGMAFRGEAVILGRSYLTIYQPIFSPVGDVQGIL